MLSFDAGIQSVPTKAAVSFTTRRDGRELRDARVAMRLSLIIGLVMLIGKTTAYFMTHDGHFFRRRRVSRPCRGRGFCCF